MKLKKHIRVFKEPYTKEEKFWVLDTEEGDIYKIPKDMFEVLTQKEINSNDLDFNTIKYLKELGVIEE